MIERYHARIVIGILFLATLLRVGFLWYGDTTTDEVLYAFRAVGMIDFDESQDQTTPLEWFDPNIPWWTSLSFHDHPPLVFAIQHFFMSLFGETRFAFRLPSALFGVASVYLLYRISALLYGVRAGLLAASILAITTNHLYISRIGLQESYVIFFTLLSLFFLLRTRDHPKFWLWLGGAIGCGLLVKYVTFFVVPIIGLYTLAYNRYAFRVWQLWVGAALALALFSPVLLYNVELYRAVGHFDFQFSYIFGQHPDVWSVTPGKEIGTLVDRIRVFPARMLATHSPVFLGVSLVAFLLLCARFVRAPRELMRRHAFAITALMMSFVLIAGVGPSYRFLTILTPFLVLIIAGAFPLPKKLLLYVLVLCFGVVEVLYAWNTVIAYHPIGRPTVAYATGARTELYNWGYNELSDYLTHELKGKEPVVSFDVKYKFLDELQIKAAQRYERGTYEPYNVVIVYDGNVQSMAQIWVLDRLNMYHAWPVVKYDHYTEYMRANAITDITKAGFENYYFIVANERMPMKKPEYQTILSRVFEEELLRRAIEPIRILNKRGEEAFRVYKIKGI